MKKILCFTMLVFATSLVTGCGEAEVDPQSARTPEQQEQADRLYDMGEQTDRSKSKEY